MTTNHVVFAIDDKPVWFVRFHKDDNRAYVYICTPDELIEKVFTGRHAPDQDPPYEVWLVGDAFQVTMNDVLKMKLMS